jgi:hypothetical protein
MDRAVCYGSAFVFLIELPSLPVVLKLYVPVRLKGIVELSTKVGHTTIIPESGWCLLVYSRLVCGVEPCTLENDPSKPVHPLGLPTTGAVHWVVLDRLSLEKLVPAVTAVFVEWHVSSIALEPFFSPYLLSLAVLGILIVNEPLWRLTLTLLQGSKQHGINGTRDTGEVISRQMGVCDFVDTTDVLRPAVGVWFVHEHQFTTPFHSP